MNDLNKLRKEYSNYCKEGDCLTTYAVKAGKLISALEDSNDEMLEIVLIRYLHLRNEVTITERLYQKEEMRKLEAIIEKNTGKPIEEVIK